MFSRNLIFFSSLRLHKRMKYTLNNCNNVKRNFKSLNVTNNGFDQKMWISCATNLYVNEKTSTSDVESKKLENEIKVTFITANGEKIISKGKKGESLLDVVVNNNLDFDGFGACEGTLTCSTCHIILQKEDYERLPEKPSDEELDMLDLAYELTDTSRLGCQIILSEELNGLEVKLPSTINDARDL